MKPSFGVGLGRPVQRMLQGTNRICRNRPHSGGTSRNGTHRAPPSQTLRIDEVAALPSPQVMLSCRLKRYYCRLRRPPGTPPTSRNTGYRARSSSNHPQSPGRGGPLQFPPPPFDTFRAPYAGESLGACTSRSSALSVAFALMEGARHSLIPARRRAKFTTPQASLHATDRIIAPPITGLMTLGFNAGRFPPTLPACYRASWQLPGPDSHRQATTSLRTRRTPWHYVTVSPPALLGARKIRANGKPRPSNLPTGGREKAALAITGSDC